MVLATRCCNDKVVCSDKEVWRITRMTHQRGQAVSGWYLAALQGWQHSRPACHSNGCKLLILWTERTSREAADLSDFVLAKKAAA
jgi:hypothetical protein